VSVGGGNCCFFSDKVFRCTYACVFPEPGGVGVLVINGTDYLYFGTVLTQTDGNRRVGNGNIRLSRVNGLNRKA
jgi:hypothetical protein